MLASAEIINVSTLYVCICVIYNEYKSRLQETHQYIILHMNLVADTRSDNVSGYPSS